MTVVADASVADAVEAGGGDNNGDDDGSGDGDGDGDGDDSAVANDSVEGTAAVGTPDDVERTRTSELGTMLHVVDGRCSAGSAAR